MWVMPKTKAKRKSNRILDIDISQCIAYLNLFDIVYQFTRLPAPSHKFVFMRRKVLWTWADNLFDISRKPVSFAARA